MFSALLKRLMPVASPPAAAPRFTVPAGQRVYAIGDIHGRYEALRRVMTAIEADILDQPEAEVTIVFLGDYVDRGMHSREVLELLSTPAPPHRPRICLMGNHEMALLQFLRDPMHLREWGNFGGYATLASYGIGIPSAMTPAVLYELRDRFRKAMPPAHRTFLESLEYHARIGDYLFVHAGIIPGVALENQSRETMVRIREPFLSYHGYYPYYIVHGHTPLKEAELHPNRANLDVSDAPGEQLACLAMEGDTRRLLHIGAASH